MPNKKANHSKRARGEQEKSKREEENVGEKMKNRKLPFDKNFFAKQALISICRPQNPKL